MVDRIERALQPALWRGLRHARLGGRGALAAAGPDTLHPGTHAARRDVCRAARARLERSAPVGRAGRPRGGPTSALRRGPTLVSLADWRGTSPATSRSRVW